MTPSALRIDPRDAAPIFRQIEEGLRRLVSLGTLVPGASVPSVRDLATELRVNPATVSKAYQRLTEAGVLEVRRGEGTFVAAAPPALAKNEKQRSLRDAAERYVHLAVTLGASEKEARLAVDEAWPDEKKRFGGGGR